jgi:ribosomal protein S18 acetylase RimI-like enzyme
MESIHIRPMTADDIPLVVHWMVEIPLWQRYQITAARAHTQFESGLTRQDILLVADCEASRACGFAWCLPEGMFGRSAYLKLIGVRPELAAGGVGSALLAVVEQAALAFGDALFLLVSDFNRDAQRFYQRHGYREVGVIPGYVLADVNELLYWKRISKG